MEDLDDSKQKHSSTHVAKKQQLGKELLTQIVHKDEKAFQL